MEHLATIITLASTVAGLIATAATFMGKFIKTEKEKRKAEQTIRICDAIMPFIRQAEAFLNYSAKEKKEFVITKANQFAIEHKIPFNAVLIDGKIEELVRLTREVNRRDKDMHSDKANGSSIQAMVEGSTFKNDF